jgi:hypothetical protein
MPGERYQLTVVGHEDTAEWFTSRVKLDEKLAWLKSFPLDAGEKLEFRVITWTPTNVEIIK